MMTVPHKSIYRFNEIPIKIPTMFYRNRKTYPKIQMESQRTSNIRMVVARIFKKGGMGSYFLMGMMFHCGKMKSF